MKKTIFSLLLGSMAFGSIQTMASDSTVRANANANANASMHATLNNNVYINPGPVHPNIHVYPKQLSKEQLEQINLERDAEIFLKHLQRTLPSHILIGDFLLDSYQQYQKSLEIVQTALQIAKKNCWLIEGTRCRELMNQLSLQYSQVYHESPYLGFMKKPFPVFSNVNKHVSVTNFMGSEIEYYGISRSYQKNVVQQLKDLEEIFTTELHLLKAILNTQTFAKYY